MEEIKNKFLYELSLLKESEDHIEFKEAKRNFNYNGGKSTDPKERRHCILGYVAALANEGGGRLVFGMHDDRPHYVVGTTFEQGNLGALEDAIYEKMKIRVRIDEVFEPSEDVPDRKRVIIFNVPSRPIGKTLRFEGVPLMRTGESLREMDDAELFKILSEQEPDYSAKICEGLTIEDLDSKAIEVMKQKYAEKNENPGFESVSDVQALSDLDLMVDGKLNYAALVLLGKTKAIRKFLPQNDVVIKQSPTELTITNAGGFPIGVDTNNVLTVNSTPRSKRLAEVLQKTGLVEKSGQGVDKMFTNCIMEAKPLPDFSATDNYQVSLKFRTEIRSIPFLIYIRQEQAKRPKHHKLNVFQLMAIYNVCFSDGIEVKKSTIDELVTDGILLRTKTGKLSMPKDYRLLVSEITHHGDVNGEINGDVNGEINGPVNSPVNGLVSSLKGSLKDVYMIVKANPGIKIKKVAELRDKSESTVGKQLTDLKKKGFIEYRGANKTGGYYAKK